MRKSELRRMIREEIQKVREEYYPSRKENPMYVDANDIELSRVFVHTNRNTTKQGKNGMLGIYKASGCKWGGSPYGHTNAIFLKGDICFYVNEMAALRIAQKGHRTIVSGVIGDVADINSAPSGGVRLAYRPSLPYYHVYGDPSTEVIGANSVYLYATPNGDWRVMGHGIKTVAYDGRYDKIDLHSKFQK